MDLAAVTPSRRLYAVDSDEPILRDDNHARSALLFGPPGTGKTTLVESLAGALDWSFIEITPAAFLNEGVDHVSARADLIFRQIMEVDRCVVLLDEIDELIQRRGPDTDPLERFFTTTMLPRLAKLWDRGRVLFFVNTNDVTRVDPAIRRSQRFDSAVLVLPPSYESKVAHLVKDGVTVPVSPVEVSAAYTAATAVSPKSVSQDGKVNPAWFALMRHDQIDSFGAAYTRYVREESTRRRGSPHPAQELDEREIGEVKGLAFDGALSEVVGELLALDWLPDEPKPVESGSHPAPSASVLPTALAKMRGAERRDTRRRLVWATQDSEGGIDYLTLPFEARTPPAWADEQGYDVDAETGRLVERTSLNHPDASATTAAAVPSDGAGVQTERPVGSAPTTKAGAAATAETTDATPLPPAGSA